ncbi:hypothetical protein AC579_6457 [Pseudocercospora musae]|uniref:Uncharacterized protein n=1 Tax=Pseudocercospora musae TaxID=113226 RepID=A0A139IK90_9PEZI|nr:hypothetical protein AC579_6457 [Pseudocercospora musae]
MNNKRLGSSWGRFLVKSVEFGLPLLSWAHDTRDGSLIYVLQLFTEAQERGSSAAQNCTDLE